MTTRKQCQFWDCDETIPWNFFLCSTHHAGYEAKTIDRCPSSPPCGRYKDAGYDVCMPCYRQTAGAWTNRQSDSAQTDDPRKRYDAQYRTTDGHYVRSRAEVMIDDWLFNHRIAHAYERKLPVEENVISDFYIPQGEVYVEFWGKENDPIYAKRMAEKQKIYSTRSLKLISLTNDELYRLDDHMPGLLRQHGVQLT